MKDAKKVAAFLLEQELPNVEALVGGESSSTIKNDSNDTKGDASVKEGSENVRYIQPVEYVRQMELDNCRCRHLQDYLPHSLDPRLVRRSTNKSGWVVGNPIHSLHLDSQMPGELSYQMPASSSWRPPILFGDEEQRRAVLSSEGISEYWFPFDGQPKFPYQPTSLSSNYNYNNNNNENEKNLETKPQSTPSSPLNMDDDNTKVVEDGNPPPSNTTATDDGKPLEDLPTTSPPIVPVETPSSTTNILPPSTEPGESTLSNNDEKEDTNNGNNVEDGAVVATSSGDSLDASSKMIDASVEETPKEPMEVEEGSTIEIPKPDDALSEKQEGGSSTSIVPPITKEEPSAPIVVPDANGEESMDLDEPKKETVVVEDDSKETLTTSDKETTTSMDEDKSTETAKVPVTERDENDVINDNESPVLEEEKKMEQLSTTDTNNTDADGVVTKDSDPSGGEEEESPSKETGAQDPKDIEPPMSVTDKGDINTMEVDTSISVQDKDTTVTETKTVDTTSKKIINDGSPNEAKAEEGIDTISSTTAPLITDAPDNSDKPLPDNLVSSSADEVPPTLTSSPINDGVQEDVNMEVDDNVDPVPLSSTEETPLPVASVPEPMHELTDERYQKLKTAENGVWMVRRSIVNYGRAKVKKTDNSKKKRKKDFELFRSSPLPGWVSPPGRELNKWQEKDWECAREEGPKRVEMWLENYRQCRESYWEEQRRFNSNPKPNMMQSSFYLSQDAADPMRCCIVCSSKSKGDGTFDGKSKRFKRRLFMGDELMQCLECGFTGCSPKSVSQDSHQHILRHLLMTGHQFAVSCGESARLFCFCCGDFVYHEVFEQEKMRIDFENKMKYLAWKRHKIQRSFDPFQFMVTDAHGILWKGPIATYPILVPKEHSRATELISRRKSIFDGNTQERWMITKPNVMSLASLQQNIEEIQRYQICAPVGMYNLGNTCFKSAILQCLIHCRPLQKYFLGDVGHHHKSCKIYRDKIVDEDDKSKSEEKVDSECLACEVDRLFLSYYGSTIGGDMSLAIDESSSELFNDPSPENEYTLNDSLEFERGKPLIISDLLTTTWRSGGMKHLAGYEQRDAHEFLNSFLDLLGKNTQQHRDRVHACINTARDDNAIVSQNKNADIVKQLFEGTLRSVFLCEECGEKRMHHEAFMNISLTVSEGVEKMSVNTCLEHFILAEKLGDAVECPHCAKRTSTKKQHTFSQLPKVLCLHLKRFDAARNKKIDDFVSFPAKGLNMGPYLSHWCEVSSVPSSNDARAPATEPRILYDLFGTVNHIGNMQSGHYVTNVKVKDQWYHCNDAHISRSGMASGEEAVLKGEGAYLLFYTRRR